MAASSFEIHALKNLGFFKSRTHISGVIFRPFNVAIFPPYRAVGTYIICLQIQIGNFGKIRLLTENVIKYHTLRLKLKNKTKMRKIGLIKAFSISLAILAICASAGFFVPRNTAEAAKSKVTKWQTKLVKMGIDQALWQKYLPKISRKECNKVMKAWKKTGGTAQATAAAPTSSLGPEITVGLIEYTKSNLKDSPFRIHANKDYNIRNKDGTVLASVPAATETKVNYDSSDNMKVSGSIADTVVAKEVSFDAADRNNGDIIFDINKSNTNYDQYRGKMKLRYYDGSGSDADRIWAINTLPLEQYVWGMGEITGTGPTDHNRVMTTAFRTYGYWYITYANKYKNQGFKLTATSGNQIYYGYDHEVSYPRIKVAADDTRGKIVKYKGEIAITPYSSWTDGRTRSWKERWGSSEYPWCKSVEDPYGKNSSMSTKDLENAGNHMVGLSAHGSLKLADPDEKYKWDWEKILKYYFTGIDISSIY